MHEMTRIILDSSVHGGLLVAALTTARGEKVWCRATPSPRIDREPDQVSERKKRVWIPGIWQRRQPPVLHRARTDWSPSSGYVPWSSKRFLYHGAAHGRFPALETGQRGTGVRSCRQAGGLTVHTSGATLTVARKERESAGTTSVRRGPLLVPVLRDRS
jgi:hypothetical protein